jgi:hypothetical protein
VSDHDQERVELARKARRQQERLAEYAAAVERGEVPSVEHDGPFDDDEPERWARAGEILREHDPVTYRMLSAIAWSTAALKTLPPEN